MALVYMAGLSCTLNRLLQVHVESVVEWDMWTIFAGVSVRLVTRVLVNYS